MGPQQPNPHALPNAAGPGASSRGPYRLEAGPTAIEFFWDGDRWRHTVVVEPGAGARQAAWCSVEGAIAPLHDPRRPASPVIREVSVLGPPHAPAALLGVGHAGGGHCSLAVTVDDRDPASIRLQVACRLAAPWPGLGSTYGRGEDRRAAVVALPEQAAPTVMPGTVEWTYRVGPAGIEALDGTVVRPFAAAVD